MKVSPRRAEAVRLAGDGSGTASLRCGAKLPLFGAAASERAIRLGSARHQQVTPDRADHRPRVARRAVQYPQAQIGSQLIVRGAEYEVSAFRGAVAVAERTAQVSRGRQN